ncbi:TIGR04255 family protein [Actinokineospora enzanensis]|uniref:TIGR04255 family protein n=1 Tax=Actinokineospora enzanensis TaxID=155975 RepID=UPI000A026F88|nr:TIGR04255 family protein [Actinokineospora enzanensis]
MSIAPAPFEPAPPEVPLPAAPLVTVLSQIRWVSVTHLKTSLDTFAKRFGEKISNEYPIYGEHHQIQLIVTPTGATQEPGGMVYQFRSPDETWKVSFSEVFITLETSRYTSRADFCHRFRHLLEVLAATVEIPIVERIGFRYVNRVDKAEDYSRITELVNSQALGITRIPQLVHSISEAVYKLNDANLLARSVFLPPEKTFDPIIKPSPNKSWILDLDAYVEERSSFSSETLSETASKLSGIAYGYFRWAITPEFLKAYGGGISDPL